MNLFDYYLQQARVSPKAPLSSSVQAEKWAEAILAQEWTPEDVMELAVDEISMATNVGTGLDSALGGGKDRDEYDDEEESLEKLIRAYKESDRSVSEFLSELDLSDSLESKFRKRVIG